VLKISSVRFNARLDTSHHGSSNPLKDVGTVPDGLTDIRNAMVKCLFVANMSCIHKRSQVPPQITFIGLKSGECGDQPVGFSLPVDRS
jgi:hypothetical protein